jgi:hypothetical protein
MGSFNSLLISASGIPHFFLGSAELRKENENGSGLKRTELNNYIFMHLFSPDPFRPHFKWIALGFTARSFWTAPRRSIAALESQLRSRVQWPRFGWLD